MKVFGKKLVELGSMNMEGIWDDRGGSRDIGVGWAEGRGILVVFGLLGRTG